MLLMIDNYDSFTYNLVQYFGELGEDVRTFRNDEISFAEIAALNPDRICLSPGPCSPKEAGICVELLQKLGGTLPILGVCLGHQAIGEAFGGEVIRAQQVMHGKTSLINHTGVGVFKDFPLLRWVPRKQLKITVLVYWRRNTGQDLSTPRQVFCSVWRKHQDHGLRVNGVACI